MGQVGDGEMLGDGRRNCGVDQAAAAARRAALAAVFIAVARARTAERSTEHCEEQHQADHESASVVRPANAHGVPAYCAVALGGTAPGESTPLPPVLGQGAGSLDSRNGGTVTG